MNVNKINECITKACNTKNKQANLCIVYTYADEFVYISTGDWITKIPLSNCIFNLSNKQYFKEFDNLKNFFDLSADDECLEYTESIIEFDKYKLRCLKKQDNVVHLQEKYIKMFKNTETKFYQYSKNDLDAVKLVNANNDVIAIILPVAV